VAQTGQPSRHDGEAWQRSLGQVDVEGIVEQRFEGLDRFELFRQQAALTNVEVTDRLGTRQFRHARGRKPQGGANLWHEHHLAICSLEAGRSPILPHDFTLVQVTVPSGPRSAVVDAASIHFS
jgi:hypothetical protein